MGGKRKGTDLAVDRSVAVTKATSLDDIALELKMMRNRLAEDPSSNVLAPHKQAFEAALDRPKLEAQARQLQNDLDERMQKALLACQAESDQLYQLQLATNQLTVQRDTLAAQLEHQEQELHDLQDAIAHYQTTTLPDALPDCDRTIARLRQQISLYGSISGVKWDFAHERVLSGHVVRTLF